MEPEEWFALREEWAVLKGCNPKDVPAELVWYWKLPREIEFTPELIEEAREVQRRIDSDD